jgi:hypothetical protein
MKRKKESSSVTQNGLPHTPRGGTSPSKDPFKISLTTTNDLKWHVLWTKAKQINQMKVKRGIPLGRFWMASLVNENMLVVQKQATAKESCFLLVCGPDHPLSTSREVSGNRLNTKIQNLPSLSPGNEIVWRVEYDDDDKEGSRP